MDYIEIEKATLYFVDGSISNYENVKFSQKATVMVFEKPDGTITIVNFDNLIKMSYKEKSNA